MAQELEEWNGMGLNRKVKRVIIFWDHANTFHPLQELGVRINYELAKRKLSEGYYLFAAIMYMGMPSFLFDKKKKFLKALRKIGWVIFEKPLRQDSSGKFLGAKKQTGVDELMYSDIKHLAEEDAFEKAIIVSGDAVFSSLIKHLHKLGKIVDLWSFRHCLAGNLIPIIGKDHIFFLDDILEDIRYAPKKS